VSTLAWRLGLGCLLGAVCFMLTLDRSAAGDVWLAVGYLGIVGIVSWRFGGVGRWATVAAAAVAWTAAKGDLRGPDPAWPGLGGFWAGEPGWRGVLGPAALRLGSLAALAATVATLRSAVRRFVRTEDALALSLLRERDSARRDRLTRLWNARYLHEALEQEIARCGRYGRPFGLLVLDLDGFKAVNDTGGHEAGDRVLQIVGRVLRENCRASDIPARLGGDEFAVVLPEASPLTVPRYAAKLVDRVARAPFPPGLPAVTASVGAVVFERAPASVQAALALADEAMYAAKREGKNRVAVRGGAGAA
jgi:diguanylate cyclase (GGDEF)-like protein